MIKNWENIVVRKNKNDLSNASWDITSDKNWYFIKLISGVLSNDVYITTIQCRRLFISEKKTTIVKFVDDIGELR